MSQSLHKLAIKKLKEKLLGEGYEYCKENFEIFSETDGRGLIDLSCFQRKNGELKAVAYEVESNVDEKNKQFQKNKRDLSAFKKMYPNSKACIRDLMFATSSCD